MMKKLFLLAAGISVAFSACYYDNLSELHPPGFEPCDSTSTVTYSNQVAEIFKTSCGTNSGCHSAGIAEGNIILDNYADAAAVNDATMMEAIEQTGPLATQMPPDGSKLSDCSIFLIEKWIQTGKQP